DGAGAPAPHRSAPKAGAAAPAPSPSMDGADDGQVGGRSASPPADGQASGRSASPPADGQASGRSASPPADARSYQRAEPRPSDRPGLGPEFGEQRYSRVEFTRFERDNPTSRAAILEVRYNDRRGLVTLGIPVDSPPREPRSCDLCERESADPFPSG